MGVRQGVANLAIVGGPLVVGLLLTIASAGALIHPIASAWLTLAIYGTGLALFLVSKFSLIRRGIYLSVGSRNMSAWNRRAYRAGYLLMAIGLIGTLAILIFTIL